MYPQKTERERKRIIAADDTLVLGARHSAHNVGRWPITWAWPIRGRIVIQGCPKDNHAALGYVLAAGVTQPDAVYEHAMMPLLDRYILRELWPSFVLALVVATFVLFADKLLWLLSLILRNHLDLVTSVRLLGYTLPTVSGLTLPIAFLIGCTLTFNRLSMDSEYVVFRAAGISLGRMLVPLGVAAVVVYGLSSFVLMYVSPWGFQGLQHLFFEVARSRAYYHLQAREFNDTFKGLVLYVERTMPEQERFEGVFIADTRSDVSQIITARAGTLVIQPEALRVILRLDQGTIHRSAPPYSAMIFSSLATMILFSISIHV